MTPSSLVNADGTVVDRDFVLRQGRHRAYGQLPQAPVTETTPFPERLLLNFREQTERDRRQQLKSEGIDLLIKATCAMFFVGCLFHAVAGRDGGRAALKIWAVVAPLAYVMGHWRESRKPGLTWEKTEWLEPGARVWRSSQRFTDPHLPPTDKRLPMDALALLCTVQSMENSDSYTLSLCELGDVLRRSHPPWLCAIFYPDTEEECWVYGHALAMRWGIDCYVEGNEWSERKLTAQACQQARERIKAQG